MSQYDIGSITTSTTGTQLATVLGSANWPAALQSTHRGSAAPSYKVRGMLWVKDVGGSPYLEELYWHDGTDDIKLGTMDVTNNTFTVGGIGSIVQGYDSNTAKLNVSQVWTQAQRFNETAVSYNSGTTTWPITTAPLAKMTFGTGNISNFDASTLVVGVFSIAIVQDATGNRTITSWASKFKFGAEGAPTLSTAANARDEFTFKCDGTNLYCLGRAFGF